MKTKLRQQLVCRVLPFALAAAFASGANAATLALDPASAVSSGGGAVPVVALQFGGDGETVGFEAEVAFDAASLEVAAAGQGGASCAANNVTGVVTVQYVDGGLAPIAAGPTTFCNLTFTVDGAVVLPEAGDPDVVFPLTIQNALYSDAAIQPVDGTETNGEIRLQGAAPDVILAFNPNAAVVFPGGTSGDTTAESIDVTVGSGTVGTGTVDNCVITGANAAAFDVVGGDPTTVPPPGSIDLEVTLANSALSATLTCDVDDAGPDATHVWSLSAPAGTPVPAPEYSSSPAPGSALTCNGQPGALTQTSITITNTGLAGVGSDLDYGCVVSGAGFSILSGAADILAVGESAMVTVQCTVPAEDAPAAEGDLDCTSNDAANSPANYPLSAGAATAPPPVPQPNVVPASSLWSQLSLIGLLAALGLLVVGIRRNH